MKYIASVSFGKDSLAMLLKGIEGFVRQNCQAFQRK